MEVRLCGKVALVTGSSRGIGLATAKAFAAEGCRVMLSARSTEQLREAEEVLRATGAEDQRRLGRAVLTRHRELRRPAGDRCDIDHRGVRPILHVRQR